MHFRGFKTERKNSKYLAFRWKIDLPWKIVNYYQRKCDKSMKFLGYPTYKSESDFFTRKSENRLESNSVKKSHLLLNI